MPKERPLRIYKDKKGSRYVLINGKKYKLESELNDRQLFNIINKVKVVSNQKKRRFRNKSNIGKQFKSSQPEAVAKAIFLNEADNLKKQKDNNEKEIKDLKEKLEKVAAPRLALPATPIKPTLGPPVKPLILPPGTPKSPALKSSPTIKGAVYSLPFFGETLYVPQEHLPLYSKMEGEFKKRDKELSDK